MSNYSDSFLDLFDQVIADLKQYNDTKRPDEDMSNQTKTVLDDHLVTPTGAKITSGPSRSKQKRPRVIRTKTDSHKVTTMYFNCTVSGCTKILSNKKKLKKHLMKKHRLFSYRCLVSGCKEAFLNRRQISSHLVSAHSNLTHFACGHCTRQCPTYKTLTVHIYSKHEAGIFSCGHATCNFTSVINRRDVINHYNSKHRVANYHCTECDSAFMSFTELKRHRVKHSGEKHFICGQCEKTFGWRTSLVSHVRSKHSK